MITIEYKISKAGDPEAMARTMERYLDRAAREVRDSMIANAGKRTVFGKLADGIVIEQPGPMERFIKPTANYARAVDEGTGPAAGQARYFPNFDNLVPFVKASATRGGEALKRAGSRARFFQEAEFVNRAFQLARYIYAHGTKPHPFIAPTAAQMTPRVHELLAQGAIEGARATLGGEA